MPIDPKIAEQEARMREARAHAEEARILEAREQAEEARILEAREHAEEARIREAQAELPQPAQDSRYANFKLVQKEDGKLHMQVQTPKGVIEIPFDAHGGAVLSQEEHRAFMQHLANEDMQSGHHTPNVEKEKAYREDILARQENALKQIEEEIGKLKKHEPITSAKIWNNIMGYLTGVVAFHWLTTAFDFVYSPLGMLRDRVPAIQIRQLGAILRKGTKVLEEDRQKHRNWLSSTTSKYAELPKDELTHSMN